MICDCCKVAASDHSHEGFRYCVPCFENCQALHLRQRMNWSEACRVTATHRCDCCRDAVPNYANAVQYSGWVVCRECYTGCPSLHSPMPKCRRPIISDEEFESFRQEVIRSLATGSQPVVRSSDHILTFAQKILNHPQ